MGAMNRVSFLVDGFNVYHSAREASRDLTGASTVWLDLRALLRSFLSSAIGRDAALAEIHYFSALATHMDPKQPGTTSRHKAYIDCLRATGIHVHLGRFKSKDVWCRSCKTNNCTSISDQDRAFCISVQTKKQGAGSAHRKLLCYPQGTVCSQSATRPFRVTERANDLEASELVKMLTDWSRTLTVCSVSPISPQRSSPPPHPSAPY